MKTRTVSRSKQVRQEWWQRLGNDEKVQHMERWMREKKMLRLFRKISISEQDKLICSVSI